MKKYIAFLICILLSLNFCITGFAYDSQNTEYSTTIEYFSDGSYLISYIEEDSVSSYATTTKNGSKTIKYCNSDNEVYWTATLKGTFTYTGSSSTCTSSSISYTIVDNSWKITSATASRSGNKATGNVTAKHYLLGIPVKTVEKTITLSCSASGVLS